MPARKKTPGSRLTERFVPTAGPGRHGDGHGLYLYVRQSGTRSWVQRLVIGGQRFDLGLGGYPLVSLTDVRACAFENRRVARVGGDPRAPRPGRAAPTLSAVLEEVIASRESGWRGSQTEPDWRRAFDKHIFPRLGDVPVDQVTLDDVIAVVQPHWKGRGSTGYLLRQRFDAVLRWAEAKRYRVGNPAAQAVEMLLKVQRDADHRASLSHTKVRAAMEALRASSAREVIKDLLLFTVLTGARLSEAAKTCWSEIDFDDSVWTLSKKRMKAGRQHQVPLSVQALEILRRLRERGHPGPFVFRFRPSRGPDGPVTGESLLYWLRKLDLRDSANRRVVTHGFRTTFCVWGAEVDCADNVVVDCALAHGPRSRTQAAYRRTTVFDKRVGLMQRWADYVVPQS